MIINMMRATVLVAILAATEVIYAQIEAHEQATTMMTSATTTTSDLQQKPSPQFTLTSLFKEQTARQQQPAINLNKAATTISSAATTTTASSAFAATSSPAATITTTNQQQEATKSTPATSSSDLEAQTAAASAATTTTGNGQFQYVKPLIGPKCQHNNQSYSIGQRWNDDCLQICECVEGPTTTEGGEAALQTAISACRNRCPSYRDPPGENCSLQRSKLDECCLDWVCDLDAKFAPSTTLMNTERGQLNVSTTEIRMPTTVSAQSSPFPSTISTQAPQTTQQTTMSSSKLASGTTSQRPVTTTGSSSQSQQLANKVIATTTTTVAASVTNPTPQPTTQATRRQQPQQVTSTVAQQSASSSLAAAPQSNRSPKQVNQQQLAQVVVTQSSPSSLPTQRPQSLITTTTTTGAPPTPRVLVAAEPEPRAIVFMEPVRSSTAATTPTTTTTTTTESSVEEADPQEVDLCIQDIEAGAFKVNQSWFEDPCSQPCRCVFRSEPRNPATDLRFIPTINLRPDSEQTEIRCGLPAQCQSAIVKLQQPSSECPQPTLVFPKSSLDRCACPRVSCAKQLPQSTPQPPVAGCRPKIPGGRLLRFGETFNDECHSTCRCFEDSQIRCQQLACPKDPPVESQPLPNGTYCADWQLEPDFRPNSTQGRCCPQFICAATAQVVTSLPVSQSFKSCTMLGKETPHGERLPEEIHEKGGECEKVCTCNDGNIICQPLCPHLAELPPEDLGCAPEQAYKTTANDDCCPKWLCPITEDYALKSFEAVALNSSSVEINFVLPVFAVGRKGQAELNFTGLPAQEARDLPPANAIWTRKPNIQTSDGIFFSQSVKYRLNNLKPNHKYWFKLVVHFRNSQPPFDEPLESTLQQVVVPPLAEPEDDGYESSSSSAPTTIISSSTTTTTTPAPPTRILQPVNRLHPTTGTTWPSSTTSGLSSSAATSTSTTTTSTTTTTTTTTEQPPVVVTSEEPQQPQPSPKIQTQDPVIIKPSVDGAQQPPPCSRGFESTNQLEDRLPLAWTDQIHSQIQGPVQRYAMHLLVALCVMTLLFTILLSMYFKKSSRVIAPITSQSAYDNPTFTKLRSYCPQSLLVDDANNQNYNNDIILAKQKNLEVDKSSPFHNNNNNNNNHINHNQHQMNDIHHHNGRQHLI